MENSGLILRVINQLKWQHQLEGMQHKVRGTCREAEQQRLPEEEEEEEELLRGTACVQPVSLHINWVIIFTPVIRIKRAAQRLWEMMNALFKINAVKNKGNWSSALSTPIIHTFVSLSQIFIFIGDTLLDLHIHHLYQQNPSSQRVYEHHWICQAKVNKSRGGDQAHLLGIFHQTWKGGCTVAPSDSSSTKSFTHVWVVLSCLILPKPYSFKADAAVMSAQ